MGMCCMENSQIAECRIKDWSSEMLTYSKVRTRAARKGLNKAVNQAHESEGISISDSPLSYSLPYLCHEQSEVYP